MGFDPKYGRVTTEHGDIPDDEPVIVLRGRDAMVPETMARYMELCEENGSPARHVTLVAGAVTRIQEWQEANPGKVRQPDSERSRAWLDH